MTADETVWVPDGGAAARAVAITLQALVSEAAVDALCRYYDPASDYAGALFTALEPNDPTRVTPTDLLAVTTLSVKMPPRAIRGVLSAEGTGRLSALLATLPVDARLEDDGVEQYAAAMAELQEATKSLLGSNPWVTASKLCARKRPHLFPVRDRLVLELLELRPDYASNWPVFATIMRDARVAARLDEVIATAEAAGADLGDPGLRLRHLDVVLWMRGRAAAR